MVKVRDAVEDDISFIYATMLRGLYYGSDYWHTVDKAIFFAKYENRLNKLLMTEGVTVKVACLPDASDVILGYAIYSHQDALHWIFVKQAWRRQGLATLLAPGPFKCSTAHTNLGELLRNKHKIAFIPLDLYNNL